MKYISAFLIFLLLIVSYKDTVIMVEAVGGYNDSFGQSLSLDGYGDYVEFGPKPGDLIAHWNFENNLLDSENSNNLTWQGSGSPSYAPGHVGQGVLFNGSNTAFVPDNVDFNFGTEVMIAGSFKTNSNSIQTIVSQWNPTGNQRGWLVRLTADGKIEFLASSDGAFPGIRAYQAASGISGLNDGNFHRFSIHFGAGEFNIYIDGVKDTSVSYTYSSLFNIFNSTGNFVIGGRQDGIQSFVGLIDDIQLYSGGQVHVVQYLSANPGYKMSDLLGDMPDTLNFLSDTRGSISMWLYSNIDILNGGDHGALFSYGGNDSPGNINAGFGLNYRRTDSYAVGQRIYLYQGNEESSWVTSWSLLNSADVMQKERWYHLVLSSDGDEWTLYLDGEEVLLENNSAWLGNHGDWFGDTFFKSGGDSFSIGARLWGVWGGESPNLTWWNGNIDDFRIYSEPLSAQEIESLYNGENITNNLRAYWDFNGNAEDKSGNGQHGFLRGDATFTAPLSSAPMATLDNDFLTWNSGNINVNYKLIDDDLDILNISQTASSGIEYSLDGLVWFSASDAGGDSDGLINLSSSSDPGESHVFVWDSLEDLPNVEDSEVYIRIRPNDGQYDAEAWTISNAFGLDNLAPSSVGSPSFGNVTTSSISIIKPDTVTENGSGLNEWQVRRVAGDQLGLNNILTQEVIDNSLTENTQYVYEVQFTDNVGNVSDYGAQANKYTLVADPTNLRVVSHGSESSILEVDSFTNDQQGLSGYLFENKTTGNSSGWIDSNVWEDISFIENQTNEYSVIYRNAEGVETNEVAISFLNAIQVSEPTVTRRTTYGVQYCNNLISTFCANRVNINTTNILNDTNNKICPQDKIITQNLRSGSRNGFFNSYTNGVVRQADLLQEHLNRLGFNSGPVDGILGPISDGAIKRMQISLGTTPDGFVGPITRGLINNSC